MTTNKIEQRLSLLEQEVARLKLSLHRKHHPVHALEKIHGTFADDEAFREAMRLGRKWRHSLGSQPQRKPRAKRK
jgi:hypothetical protein